MGDRLGVPPQPHSRFLWTNPGATTPERPFRWPLPPTPDVLVPAVYPEEASMFPEERPCRWRRYYTNGPSSRLCGGALARMSTPRRLGSQKTEKQPLTAETGFCLFPELLRIQCSPNNVSERGFFTQNTEKLPERMDVSATGVSVSAFLPAAKQTTTAATGPTGKFPLSFAVHITIALLIWSYRAEQGLEPGLGPGGPKTGRPAAFRISIVSGTGRALELKPVYI
ncbi:hypothetical protein HPB50_026860 [Hyalomma asiaticum]|uniref:Uncharacterized protein n=1 Tax=Hyalomma asiaticum TaxID=266040 RepID=A0ACB7S3M9_HYAAI|nr:hypothetical protein HPB50_026860 [Hyalomma asiaticum]